MAFQASPMLKFENSPAESFISTPGESYSSLFAVSTPTASNTMNPMEMMTPQSCTEDKYNPSAETTGLPTIPESESSPAPTSEKKTTKKRKSWGQVLPEPKTNLPPRKRAKTEDEKEQRRVERVLRNRRAAQSSRERKRLEVEALEQRNKELITALAAVQEMNLKLQRELAHFRETSGVATRSSSPLRDNPALSQQLFSSQDGHELNAAKATSPMLKSIMLASGNQTVNPASLSPELAPVSDEPELVSAPEQPSEDAQASELNSATSPDLTQRPAEMLCDLQCQMSAELPKSFLASQTSMPPTLAMALTLRVMLLSASAIITACQRPLMQIAMSSKAGFSLLPTPQLLTKIIWLVTMTTSNRSTSTTSSTTTEAMSPRNSHQQANISPQQTTVSKTTNSTTLRLKSLRKLLSSSPSLARPLLDATMAALRLVSEGRDIRVENSWNGSHSSRGNDCELTRCLKEIDLPSTSVLMTLAWTLQVYEKRRESDIRQRSSTQVLVPEKNSAQKDSISTHNIILRKQGGKRKLADIGDTRRYKRGRLS